MREQAKLVEKQREGEVKTKDADNVSQQIKFNAEVRKELEEDRLRYAQVTKQLEEQRKEFEKAGQWSPGWILLAGVVIGMLVNLAFSVVSRCCKKRQPSHQVGRQQQ